MKRKSLPRLPVIPSTRKISTDEERCRSRGSVTPLNHLSFPRSSLINYSKIRSHRLMSRLSMLSRSNSPSDHCRLVKGIPFGPTDHFKETIPNGIHLEFQFSKEIQSQDKTQHPSNNNLFINHLSLSLSLLVGIFDINRMNNDSQHQQIISIQNRCQRLLTEMKQKMFVRSFVSMNLSIEFCLDH